MAIQTFGQLVDRYLEQHIKDRPSSVIYRRLHHTTLQPWWVHPTETVTRPMVRKLHQSLAATPSQANKLLGLIKQAYTWAQNTEDDQGELLWSGENPATGVQRHQTYSRIRVMTDAELGRLLTAFEELTPKMRAFLTVLLCTGCRMSEARQMRWEHVDLDAGRWLKPKTKNGLAQYMSLPQQAVAAIRAITRQGDFIFMGQYGHCWSRAGAEKSWGQIRPLLGLSDVTLHDFRRTVATRLYEAEEDELLVKACLNHYDGRPIAVYVRLNFDRLARALQAQADRLWALPRVPFTHAPVSAPIPSTDPTQTDLPTEEDLPFDSVLLEAWGKLPPEAQQSYLKCARHSGTPLFEMLTTAVDEYLTALETDPEAYQRLQAKCATAPSH